MNTTIKLEDDDDALGYGGATVELAVDFVVHPGERGCRYTANGDGWPPTPPEVEITHWRVVKVTAAGAAVTPHAEALPALVEWVVKRIADDRESIEGELLAYAEDTP